MDSHRKHSRSGRGYRRKSKGPGQSRPQKLNRIFGIVSAIIGGALLLLVAYVAGRNSASPGAVVPVDTRDSTAGSSSPAMITTPEVMQQIDRALILFQDGSIDDAIQALSPYSEQGNPSIQVLLARLQGSREEYAEAVKLLAPEITHHAVMPDVHLMRAGLLMRNGTQPAAFIEYEAAARLAPLNPEIFLQWGQALRDFGRTREGMQRLEQASRRASKPGDLLTVHTRVLLARVELEDSATLKAEAAPILNTGNPDPAWLIAMAAIALRENEPSLAAEWFTKAKNNLPADFLEALVEDPVFNPYVHTPEVAIFLRSR